jgi:Secretion system C-terminal sorting domain
MTNRSTLFLSLFILILTFALCLAYPDGSKFEGRTGAPGESTCSSCHGGNLNNGSGMSAIRLPGGGDGGDTIDVTAFVASTGQERWGFELTVLDGDELPAGELIVTNAFRTQKSIAGNGRQYIKQTEDGTDTGTSDSTKWLFKWVAPQSFTSPIVFYMSGLASNDGSGTNGDTTYTTTQTILITGIREIELEQIPESYELSQNYPNPFNPATNIRFDLPREAHVTLSVHNILGGKIVTLVDKILSAGSYVVDWDARNFASGIYYYTINADNFEDSKKMLLIK